MSFIETGVLVFYFAVLAVLSLYGAHRYWIAWLYHRHRRNAPEPAGRLVSLPRVTIQLPVFNEYYVVERLIDAVCRIRYPRELLEVQVLDDSTDDSVDVAREVVERWRAAGVDIVHVHRTDRTGFKAGALEAGMEQTKGEFVAVFDADFLPEPDFLERTIHHFSDPGVGMVQARWEHLNRDFSTLTQAQSILLDGHFVLEHTARNRSGRFFNFNGTAGIWRKATIADAGGWQHDTLTEDLDLSYRAQMAGWRFVFLTDVLSPAEVPVDVNAFKSQQHRWAKGSIQTARKLLPRILRADLPLRVKAEAFVHLTSNIAYVLMVGLSVAMPFAMVIRVDHGWHQTFMLDIPAFLAATVSVCFFYLYSQREARQDGLLRRALHIPLALAIGIGMSFNQARAVIEALADVRSPFVRTPKFAVTKRGQSWHGNRYVMGADLQVGLELAMAASFAYPEWVAWENGLWYSLPFLVLFQVGYAYVGLGSLVRARGAAVAVAPVA